MLLILGGNRRTVQKADALGLETVSIRLKEQPGAYRRLGAATILTDFTDWPKLRPLAKAAYDAWGFKAAVSLTEPGLDPAGRVNDMLQLGGTPYEVSHRFTDKLLMRRRLAARGVGPAVAAEAVGDRVALAGFGRRHGYPFIVKPVAATAGFGVFRVDGESGLDAAWARIARLREAGATRWPLLFEVGGFMAEEYVDGPEYSVEAFSFAGRHVAVAITEKTSLGFVEIAHALPARLDPAAEEAVTAAVTRFLDAMELRDGPSHTELRLTGRGPVIIESHNRVGGGRINEMVLAAYGVDLETYTLGWPFRLVDELSGRPRPLGAAATRFVLGEPGTLIDVAGADRARSACDVVSFHVDAVPGSVVRRPEHNGDRLGQLVATGRDVAEAIATCEEALSRVVVHVRQDLPTRMV